MRAAVLLGLGLEPAHELEPDAHDVHVPELEPVAHVPELEPVAHVPVPVPVLEGEHVLLVPEPDVPEPAVPVPEPELGCEDEPVFEDDPELELVVPWPGPAPVHGPVVGWPVIEAVVLPLLLVLGGSASNFVLQHLLVLSPAVEYCHLGLELLAGASVSERMNGRLSETLVASLCCGPIVVEDFGLAVAPGKQFGLGQGLDGLAVLVKLPARLRWESYVDSSVVVVDYGAVADKVLVDDAAERGHRLEGPLG